MLLLPPPLVNRVHCMDVLELMRLIPAGSVDAIITDLPYGTTACSWDEIIPFAPMWAGVKRVLKPRGVFVTTASQPFTSKLVMSNLDWFKYEWIWDKVQPSNFASVKYVPLYQHENVLVFANKSNYYNPQYTDDITPLFGKKSKTKSEIIPLSGLDYRSEVGYPKTILRFMRPNNLTGGGLHPTQKPVALYEYLIRTYTQPGELVLDFCAGSGTTAVAARNLNRRYIVGDSSREYCDLMEKRLAQAYTPNMFERIEPPLFQGDKLYRPAGI